MKNEFNVRINISADWYIGRSGGVKFGGIRSDVDAEDRSGDCEGFGL